MIIKVPVGLLDEIWPMASRGLSRCIRRSSGELTEKWLYDRIRNGCLDLWAAGDREIDLWIVTEIMPCCDIRVLHITALGGKNLLRHAAECERHLRGYAEKYGCVRIQAWARPGLKRVLSRLFEARSDRILLTRSI